MFDAISKLVESGVIGEDTKKSIEEAWDSKVKENQSKLVMEIDYINKKTIRFQIEHSNDSA